MGTRTDGGELRVHAFRVDHGQLNQRLDYESSFRFLLHTVRPWTCVELSRKDQEIPASQNSKMPNVEPSRLDLLSAHPSHHNKSNFDPGSNVHTNVRPR